MAEILLVCVVGRVSRRFVSGKLWSTGKQIDEFHAAASESRPGGHIQLESAWRLRFGILLLEMRFRASCKSCVSAQDRGTLGGIFSAGGSGGLFRCACLGNQATTLPRMFASAPYLGRCSPRGPMSASRPPASVTWSAGVVNRRSKVHAKSSLLWVGLTAGQSVGKL